MLILANLSHLKALVSVSVNTYNFFITIAICTILCEAKQALESLKTVTRMVCKIETTL